MLNLGILAALLSANTIQARDLPAHGLFLCTLGGQGSCSENGICLGNRIRFNRTHPVTLQVDFDTGRAWLNNIEGQLIREPGAQSAIIEWDLSVLGRPRLTWLTENDFQTVTLNGGGMTADFHCRDQRSPAPLVDNGSSSADRLQARRTINSDAIRRRPSRRQKMR